MIPAWVSEGSIRKYHRALAQLIKEGKPQEEAAVKELYVKWGGLVIGDEEVAAPEEEAADEPKKKSSKK